ncbi:MAG: class I SAM-dependent methyltransferase [Thermosynechococcaceae cyanobacterium]
MQGNYRFLCLFIKTFVKKISHKTTINVLEPGCGKGEFIEALSVFLKSEFPEIEFNVVGFDVTVRPQITVINAGKIHLIDENDNWPYEDDSFDIVISNQVLEHVKVPTHFLKELSRVMNRGAIALHLFPTKEVLIEPHCNLPMTHWIDNWGARKKVTKIFSSMGLGKYKKNGNNEKYGLDEWSTILADMATHFIHYLEMKDYLRLSERVGLRSSFRFTHEMYLYLFLNKLNRADNISLDFDREYSFFYDLYLLSLYKRLRGIALFHEKMNVA